MSLIPIQSAVQISSVEQKDIRDSKFGCVELLLIGEIARAVSFRLSQLRRENGMLRCGDIRTLLTYFN
jgi:hypothetical protein